MTTHSSLSIVMLGATGAVGTEVVKAFQNGPAPKRLSLLGRRPVEGIDAQFVEQHKVNIFEPATYDGLLQGHDAAICTLGVGQPSKMSQEEFLKIDKLAVIDFAKACKAAGIRHFQLLASVGIDSDSSSFYLRSKGELAEELEYLEFERLSIFKPSMIITPTNRYGFSQGLLLAIWPVIDKLFVGSAKKYRGVKVNTLGQAIADNLATEGVGYEELSWEDF